MCPVSLEELIEPVCQTPIVYMKYGSRLRQNIIGVYYVSNSSNLFSRLKKIECYIEAESAQCLCVSYMITESE